MMLFVDYYRDWIETYKKGVVADVTFKKYEINLRHVERIIPKVKMKDLDRRTFQKLMDKYGETHEKNTCYDFLHQVQQAIRDALHEDLIDKDPTYRVVVKYKKATPKKKKFLNESELSKLINVLDIGGTPNKDLFLLFLAKTGVRFAEGLAVTPNDFDFAKNKVSINKTWNYKDPEGGFAATKNIFSVRDISLDQLTSYQIKQSIKDLPADEPIFVEKDKRIFNSTYNSYLERLCTDLGITVISAHSLRHTHASILLANGVSMLTVSKRLGHSDVTTTQNVYSHITEELNKKDTDLINRSLMAIGS